MDEIDYRLALQSAKAIAGTLVNSPLPTDNKTNAGHVLHDAIRALEKWLDEYHEPWVDYPRSHPLYRMQFSIEILSASEPATWGYLRDLSLEIAAPTLDEGVRKGIAYIIEAERIAGYTARAKLLNMKNLEA